MYLSCYAGKADCRQMTDALTTYVGVFGVFIFTAVLTITLSALLSSGTLVSLATSSAVCSRMMVSALSELSF